MNIKRILAYDRQLTKYLQNKPAILKWPMRFFTLCGSPVVTVGLLLLVALVNLESRNYQLIAYAVWAGVAMLIGAALKVVLHRGRPHTKYVSGMWLNTYSFPSGHSFGSVIAYGYLSHIFLSYYNSYLVAAGVAVWVFLIGYSRIYLGAHYVLDVVGGWLVGGLLLAILILLK